jgi:hypothetical protein
MVSRAAQSPSADANTKPKNILFKEAELGSHVLRMCPIQWQDQYNLNKMGMMPMELRLLLKLLEAIECVCIHEKAKLGSSKKASHKGKKGKKHSGTKSMARVPKKVFLRSIVAFARSMGADTPHTIPGIDICIGKTEK